MKKVSRREAVGTMISAGAGLTFANFLGSCTTSGKDMAMDQTLRTGTAQARAFGAQHQPRPLPFNPAKLNGLSEKLIRSHWENNYGGAVKALNVVEQRLQELMRDKDLPAYIYGDLKSK